jgi:hypothetical protein
MVRPQLHAIGAPRPTQWRPYRAFVVGYIDALADLHARNGGNLAGGAESLAMSRSVLRVLCDDSSAEVVAAESPLPELRRSADFAMGRQTALNDYDHWNVQAMSGIEAFVGAARAERSRSTVQADAARIDTSRVA